MTIFPRKSLEWLNSLETRETFRWLNLDEKVVEMWKYFRRLVNDMDF